MFGIGNESPRYQYFDAMNGVYNVQKCPKYQAMFSESVRTQMIPILKRIEEEYDCSGACVPSTHYLFSNINK